MILATLACAVTASLALRVILSPERLGDLVPMLIAHAVTAGCLAAAVLWQSTQLRWADRTAAAALVPWLSIAVPVVGQAAWWVGTPGRTADGWLQVLSHPGWVAALTLLAADGVRSTWTRSSGLLGATVVTGVLALVLARPEWATSLRPEHDPVVRAVVAASIVTAAVVASCSHSTAARWARALSCALPASALAILPTLLSTPDALRLDQRWTVVLYPAGCLAAASLAVLMVGSGELVHRRFSHTA